MPEHNVKLLMTLSVALLVVILLIPIHSGADPDLPDEAFAQTIPVNDPFPHQEELAARVNFWRHVFGVWSGRQVALHDMSNPGLVYEVLTLPEKKLGMDRSAFINQHVEDLVRRLYTLEQKVALGKELEDEEQALLEKFRTLGKITQLAGAHGRVRIQHGIRDKFVRGVEVSGRYDSLFRRIFRTHGVPEDLAFLPHVESSFQAQARSGAGAVGIWQFTLPAARTFMNVNAAVDERYDPVLAAEGCARYLARAYEKLGDWGLAITSYNHGIGGMARAESEFGTDLPRILEEYEGPLFGFDSRNFYVEFLAAREVARHAERYFATVNRERPQSWTKVALENSAPIYKVARDYGVTLTELTEMNTALTNAALQGRVSLPEGTSLWLPKDFQQRLAMREQEPETPVERIRVVRIPEPASSKMMAMLDDSTTHTKVDVPLPQRILAVKTEERDNKITALRGKTASITKAKNTAVAKTSSKDAAPLAQKHPAAQMVTKVAPPLAKNQPVKTVAQVAAKTKTAPAPAVKLTKVAVPPPGAVAKVAAAVKVAKAPLQLAPAVVKVATTPPKAVVAKATVVKTVPAAATPTKKAGKIVTAISKVAGNRRS